VKANPFLPLAFIVLAGCSSKKDDPSTCDDSAKISGVCPGVTPDTVGTDGVACSAQIAVGGSGELASKAASAPSGSCIVLAPGTYDAVTLPPGVSLIGQGASGTTVGGITTTGSAHATIRGITVGGNGIVATGKGELAIDHVLVSHTTDHGINVTDTNLSVAQTTIELAAKFGVAFSSTCTAACTDSPKLSLTSVLVREAHAVGIWAHGANVHLSGVEVDSTHAQNFQYGRGLEVAAEPGQVCSLDLASFAVLHGDDVGIYVDGCSAKLQHFVASDNLRGVQLQNIVAGGATISDFQLDSNRALGLGVSNSTSIIVQGGRIASTVSQHVPVDIGGVQEVGDGMNWLASDVAVAASVAISSSARQGVIIDNTSTGTFNGSLSGGDETRGIIVQGGLVAVVQDGLKLGAQKADVRTKDHAIPVADRVAKMKKD